MEGTYNNMYIFLTDQNGNDIFALDPNVLISVLIQFGEYIPPTYSLPPPPVVKNIQSLDFTE